MGDDEEFSIRDPAKESGGRSSPEAEAEMWN